MQRIAFNLKFNTSDVIEALAEGDKLVAEFLGIPTDQVTDRVNTELRVELADYAEGDVYTGKFTATLIGTLKNGFVFTPAT